MAGGKAKTGVLVVLCGPAGVGKSTIARRLEQDLKIQYVRSATTRQKRPGDEKGKRYEYLSEEEFMRRVEKDEFLEYAQVYDHFYGTPKHPTVDDLAAGKDLLLEIELQGALQVRYQYPKALTIYILPPDEPTLLKRLQDRKRDSQEEITRRFRAAKREIYMAKGSNAFDAMVVNDDLDKAVADIKQRIQQNRTGGN